MPTTPRSDRPRETERTMLDRLCVRYGATFKNGSYVGRRYARAEQAPTQAGRWGGHRNADFIAIDMWSTTFTKLTQSEQEAWRDTRSMWGMSQSFHGHEVKVSRADLRVELAEPEKAEAWAQYMHYWWLVVPDAELIKGFELPDTWGVLIAHGTSLRVLKQAERRHPVVMPHGVVAGLARAVMTTEMRQVEAGVAA